MDLRREGRFGPFTPEDSGVHALLVLAREGRKWNAGGLLLRARSFANIRDADGSSRRGRHADSTLLHEFSQERFSFRASGGRLDTDPD